MAYYCWLRPSYYNSGGPDYTITYYPGSMLVSETGQSWKKLCDDTDAPFGNDSAVRYSSSLNMFVCVGADLSAAGDPLSAGYIRIWGTNGISAGAKVLPPALIPPPTVGDINSLSGDGVVRGDILILTGTTGGATYGAQSIVFDLRAMQFLSPWRLQANGASWETLVFEWFHDKMIMLHTITGAVKTSDNFGATWTTAFTLPTPAGSGVYSMVVHEGQNALYFFSSEVVYCTTNLTSYTSYSITPEAGVGYNPTVTGEFPDLIIKYAGSYLPHPTSYTPTPVAMPSGMTSYITDGEGYMALLGVNAEASDEFYTAYSKDGVFWYDPSQPAGSGAHDGYWWGAKVFTSPRAASADKFWKDKILATED